MTIDQLRSEFESNLKRGLDTENIADLSNDNLMSVVMESLHISPPNDLHEAVKIDEFGKAKSTKFSHAIVFNFSQVMQVILTGAVNATAAVSFPWAGVLGTLLFVEQLRQSTSLNLSENAAKAAWALWKIDSQSEAGEREVAISKAVSVLRAEMGAKSLGLITDGEFSLAIAELEKLSVIEQIDEDICKLIDVIRVNK